MRSIPLLAVCAVLATQLVGCGPGATYDPETGVTTELYERSDVDAGIESAPGAESKQKVSNTTETCREEGSDRNYVCIRCDTAHTTTIRCTPRPVVVVGFSR